MKTKALYDLYSLINDLTAVAKGNYNVFTPFDFGKGNKCF